MTNKDTISNKPVDSAVRMSFSLSQSNPISMINHHWTSPYVTQYDMHYGVELGIVLENSMLRSWPNHEETISAGQTWICGMWEPHGFELIKTPCRALVFIIFPPMLARTFFEEQPHINLLDMFKLQPKNRPQISTEHRQRTIDLCEDLYQLNSHPKNIPGGTPFIHLKLLEVLLLLSQTIKPSEKTNLAPAESFSRINKAIEKVFSTKHYIPVDEAASLCHMHRNTFRKIFNEYMGINFAEFALRYRLTQAADKLQHTTQPIKALATEWGFVDSSHFTKVFQTYYHTSPKQFRNNSER